MFSLAGRSIAFGVDDADIIPIIGILKVGTKRTSRSRVLIVCTVDALPKICTPFDFTIFSPLRPLILTFSYSLGAQAD